MKIVAFFALILILLGNSYKVYCINPSPDGKDSCITANISYKAEIASVIKNSCIKCHNDKRSSGGISLEGYENVKKLAQSGMLKKVIEHQKGVKPMPFFASKLPDCVIKKINAWTDQGMNDN
jgi:hypothetical protein